MPADKSALAGLLSPCCRTDASISTRNAYAYRGPASTVRLENSFIGADGVGEVTERRLWEAGVTHWEEFEGDAVGPTRAANIRSFLETATERLAERDAAYFVRSLPDKERWRLYENFRDGTCFFDIETTGLDSQRDRVTTVSFHRDGETTTLVRGDDLTPAAVQAEFNAADLLVTYNGARFDIPFLESELDLTVSTPHLDAMGVCHTLDLTGGLTTAESALGVERTRPDISGRDAVRLWREHEAGSDGALETLIAYNREDTVNLRAVMDEAIAELATKRFPG